MVNYEQFINRFAIERLQSGNLNSVGKFYFLCTVGDLNKTRTRSFWKIAADFVGPMAIAVYMERAYWDAMQTERPRAVKDFEVGEMMRRHPPPFAAELLRRHAPPFASELLGVFRGRLSDQVMLVTSLPKDVTSLITHFAI